MAQSLAELLRMGLLPPPPSPQLPPPPNVSDLRGLSPMGAAAGNLSQPLPPMPQVNLQGALPQAAGIGDIDRLAQLFALQEAQRSMGQPVSPTLPGINMARPTSTLPTPAGLPVIPSIGFRG